MMIVAFDTETTGLEPGSRLLSLAAIIFDDETGCVAGQREWTVNPGMPIPPDATAINGITDADVHDAPDAGAVLREFFWWLPTDALAAHHAQYDTGIITWEAARFGVAIPPLLVLDTCAVAKSIGATKSNSLDAIVEHYGIQRCGEGHRAMSDADACRQYWMRMRQTEQFAYEWTPWGAAGHDYSYTDDLPEPLRELPELVGSGGDFAFTYKDAKDDATERTITPYGWAMKPTGLMFHGLCHLRDARRTFRADRILATAAGAAPSTAL